MCDSRYFNMFAHSGIQHIGLWFCFLFVFVLCLVRPVLLVSLDCPFLVAPSIFVKLSLFKQFIEKTLRQL